MLTMQTPSRWVLVGAGSARACLPAMPCPDLPLRGGEGTAELHPLPAQVRKTALREVELLRELSHEHIVTWVLLCCVVGRVVHMLGQRHRCELVPASTYMPPGSLGANPDTHTCPRHSLLDVFRQGGKLYLCFEFLEKTGGWVHLGGW